MFILYLLFHPVLIETLFVDEPAAPDRDLLEYRRVVPPADNAYLFLEGPLGEIFWPPAEEDEDEEEEDTDQEGREGKADSEGTPGSEAKPRVAALEAIREEQVGYGSPRFDPDLAALVLARNADLLRRYEESFAILDLQFPETTLLPRRDSRLSNWMNLGLLVAARARLRSECGDRTGALEDAVRLARLGLRVERAQGGLLVFMFGCALESIGHGLALPIAAQGSISREGLERVRAMLMHPATGHEAFADTMRAQYTIFSPCLEADSDASDIRRRFSSFHVNLPSCLANPPFFKPRLSKRLLAEDCRRFIADDAEGRPLRVSESEGLWAKVSAFDRNWLRTPAGMNFVRFVGVASEKARENSLEVRFQRAALRTLLALRAHRKDRGQLPTRLEELVPGFLDELPLDPYDLRPLRYSAEKRLLWSVGEDRVDASGGGAELLEPEGGSSCERRGGDIAIRILF